MIFMSKWKPLCSVVLFCLLFGSASAVAELNRSISIFASPEYAAQFGQPSSMIFPSENSAYEAAVPYSKLSFDTIPNADSMDEIKKVFHDIRDTQFISDDKNKKQLRRAPWLYPVDGCFVRASVGAEIIKSR